MVKTPQVKPKDQKAWREWKEEDLKRRQQRLKPRPRRPRRKKPRPPAAPAPPQRLTPTPFTPRLKPRIKPKKRDKYQVAGLLRKGGTVKRKPGKRYKKGGAAKKHRRC